MTSYHYGDNVNVGGTGNVGKIQNNYGLVDQRAAHDDLLRALQALRQQVSPADRQAIDEQLSVISAGPDQDPGTLRRALSSVAGIATVVGQVGAPVVEAVRKVMSALNM
jgi:hypothetical protein